MPCMSKLKAVANLVIFLCLVTFIGFELFSIGNHLIHKFLT